MISKNIFIASNEEDAIYISSLVKKGGRKYKIIATSYKAKIFLRNNNIEYTEIDISEGKNVFNKIISDSHKVSQKISNSKSLKEILNVEGVFLNKLFINKAEYYLWRIFEAHEKLNLLRKKWKGLKLKLVTQIQNGLVFSPAHYDFTALVATIWASYNKNIEVNVLKRKPLGTPKGNNLTLKIISTISNYADKIILKLKSPQVLFIIPAEHALNLRHLFEELSSQKIAYLAVVHNLTLRDWLKLRISGANFIKRESLSDKFIGYKTNLFSKKIKKGWEIQKKTFSLIRGNSSKTKLINSYTNLVLDKLINLETNSLIKDIFVSKKLFEDLHPEILITTTDPDPKVLQYIKEAKINEISTITLQHGAYVMHQTVNFQSEKALVWGDYYKKWFHKKLFKKLDGLVTTGSVFFDDFRIKKIKAINTRRPQSLLFLLSTTVFGNLSFFSELENTISGLPDKNINNIYIRPHPWQWIDEEKLTNLNLRISKINVASKGNVDDYIKKADLIIFMNTTAGFNALIQGKPVIYWDFYKHDKLPFAKYDLPVAKTKSELILLVREFINGNLKISEKSRKKILEDIFFKLDGNSGKRTVKYIKTYLDKIKK